MIGNYVVRPVIFHADRESLRISFRSMLKKVLKTLSLFFSFFFSLLLLPSCWNTLHPPLGGGLLSGSFIPGELGMSLFILFCFFFLVVIFFIKKYMVSLLLSYMDVLQCKLKVRRKVNS